MTYQVDHFIQGRRHGNTTSESHPITNPATGEICGNVAFASDADVKAALNAAENAYSEWSQTSPTKRARILFRFKSLLEEHSKKLAAIVTQEHGKTLIDAEGSIARGIELTEHLCGIPSQLRGTYSSNVSRDVDCYSIRQPLGVCVGISPFNFPVMVPLWLILPAIACGNTFILKPSEQDPSAPLLLAELLTKAGCPSGVINILNGDKKVVDALITSPIVKAVSAVTSTPVAEHIYLTATQHGKRAHTFGGAKNHAVVMPDADLPQTIAALTGAAFGSAGERCMAISVVVAVGDAVADQLIQGFKTAMSSLKVGPGDQNPDLGPVISAAHQRRVSDYIGIGIEEGATCVADGRGRVVQGYERGFYLGPTLFDHVKPTMRIYQEEIFGPVLCVVRVQDFDSALKLVNQNPYGNGTAIFTKDGATAKAYADQVQVGMVGINVPIPVPIAHHPFGGWNRSSFGDLGMHGDLAIQFYTKNKSVTERWQQSEGQKSSHFTMPTH